MKLTLRIPRPTRSLMGLAALALAATTWAQTNPTPQALPYTQDFSSLAHSSTVYPAGWQGWAIGGNPGASYKTTGPTTDRVLEASGDAAGTSGNVYNYNGKIGFLNSGSLDLTVGLALNTTGFSSVQVVYDIATIRNPHNGGANTRINEVSLQYRVGNSGGWTTISGQEYQNNTTTQTNSGNTDPQNQQTKTVTLPNACDNQAEVQVRWASRQVSGSGSRPSFSVDNLNVSGSGLDNTSVSFATGSSVVSEGAGSTNLTVTISSFSTTQATTVDVAIGIGDPARVGNYTTQTVTFPANDGTPQNVPVTITDDGVYDGGATVIFILQNVTGGQGTPTIGTPLDHALTITENEPSPLVINEVDYDNPGSAEDMEFVEILNNGLVAIDLNGYQIELVNGSGGAPYSTITLPSFSLAPGAYYVVGNNASIPNINLVTGAPSMIQNGSPDAVALRSPSNDLLDVISYEGSVAAPYTEGTGLDVANSDDGTPGIGISRFPNGADINDNSVDWSRRCLSPGASNNSTFEFCICEPPTATATPQCIDDNTWEIVVDVTDLGSASSVDITNNVNGASAIGVGLGQHIIGPFNNNAVVDVLVHPDDTSFCDVNLPGNFMNCMPDCLGVPGGWDVPGAPCDDQDPNTVNDTWSPTCICEGAPPQPTVSFSLPFSAVAEDGVSLTIGLEMDMAPNAPVTVEVTDLFTGTATSGTDYAPIGTVQLTFLPEDFYPALMTFNVLITDDLDDEPAETFDLALDVTNGTATVGNGNFTGQIQDNDVPALVINEVDYDNALADNAEWIELKNTGAATIELENWTVELVNGNGGGAAVYKTITLPAFSLAAGGYYVIGNNASTPNINLVVTPASDLIQNGAPDAIGLRSPDNSLVDAISYEGNTGSPYLEGVGSPVAQADDNTTAAKVIARYLDGNDTDDNSTDWKMWCATPGTSNATVDGDGDLTADCLDGCPADPSKVAPGLCGCGVSDTPVTWYADIDADTYGDALNTTDAPLCSQPVGYVDNPDDCDDQDASRHPGASEVCDDVDQDCDGLLDEDALDATTWFHDADGDGFGDDFTTVLDCDQPLDFVAVGGDCDDSDASRHPGATEVCDDADQDCDGLPDDNAVDATTWYADLDSDGYGDDLNTVVACDQPLDFVGVGGDCDDQDASRHPNADEDCDDVDDDCDGIVDDNAVDAPTWFADLDLDGFGDDLNTVVACDQPLDFVAVGGDCDDQDASRHPNADEDCDDVDDDCDGIVDDNAVDAPTWFADLDLDGFGDDLNTVVACDQPLDFVAVGGDCDDQDASRHPGATEVCDDTDQDCDGLPDDNAVDAPTWFADLDLDGFGDDLNTVVACDQPLDFVGVGGDCDDQDASRHPGATEVCDDADQDCDGLPDDNAVDAPTWFADLDLDGFGDDLNTVVTCDQPLDFVAVGGDCDDQDASRHPNADEDCDDVDDDCDGIVDDNALDAPTWFADLDLDGFGDDLNTVVTCDQPLDFVAVGGDCDDQDASRHPNADEDCDDVDDDCDGFVDDNAVDAPTWFADLDLDGFGDDLNTVVACDQPMDFVAVGGDCDDQDASRHPNADEDCDDVDDDCDGFVDDNAVDAPTWFADLDLDGFGDDLNTVVTCDQPLDFVAVGGDCDDQDASRHPNADEDCDDVDDDCDGTADDNAVDAPTWFADLDLDGFGDDLNTVVACDQPLDFVAVGGDCDDQDASRYPGASEVCDDVDQDCDGLLDEDALDATTWFHDSDGDGFGDDFTTVLDCDQPLDFVAVGGDCDDQDASRHPGASEVCDDLDQDCDGTADDNAVDAPTWYRDLDGDGFGVANETQSACDQPMGYVSNFGDCNDQDANLTVIGMPCDDGDAGTENDVITVDCACEGTPIPECMLNEVSLELTTDAAPTETTWDIVEDGTNNVQCSGGGYPMNTTITATCCLADGCYDLRVFDSAGDGISPGGFTLHDANGGRIIDNGGNGAWFDSESTAPMAFCLPLGTTAFDAGSCDILDATRNTVLHVTPDPAVTAAYVPGNDWANGNTGYHYWIFNPHGGYNRRIVLSHYAAGSGYPGGTPANLRCSYLKLSQMQSLPVPLDVPLNIRVRTLINGVYGEFGPTCKLLLPTPACPPSQLTTTATPVVSCEATGLSLNSTIYADNVVSATNYQFEFSRPGYLRRIVSPTRSQALNFYTFPLTYNTCYNVRVRISYDGGTTYCPFGPYCTITLGSGSCDFFGMAPVADESDYSDIVITDEQLTLWPNPNDGSLVNIALDGIPASVGTVSVDVMDAFGKLVATRTIPAQGGYLKTSMSFERDLAPGLYLVNVRAGGTLRTQRLVIQ